MVRTNHGAQGMGERRVGDGPILPDFKAALAQFKKFARKTGVQPWATKELDRLMERAYLKRCVGCEKDFRAGVMGERRLDAEFCSDACRTKHNNNRRRNAAAT